MAVANEIVTKFSFEGNLKPLESFNDNLMQSVKILAGFGVASVGAAAAFAGWVNNTLSGLDPMIQLSRNTGVAIETIQELGYAADVTGSSSQALQSSLAGLSQNIGKAAQFGSEEFSRLGINVRDATGQVKTADVVFKELSVRFKQLNLSMQEQQNFASALGIDPSLVQLLGQTSGQLSQLQKKARDLGVITKAQADATADYNDSITTLKFGFSSIQNAIAVGFAPELKNLTEGFISFLAANKDSIVNGIKVFGEAINTIAGTIVRLSPILAAFALGFVALKIAALGFGTVMGIILSPVVLITAAIVAILLIVDDLIVAFDGGESVIADFFKGFDIDIVKEMKSAIDFLAESFDWLWKKIEPVVNALKSIGSAAFDFIFGEGNDGAQPSTQNQISPQVIQNLPQNQQFPQAMQTLPQNQAIGAATTSTSNNNIQQNVNVNIATSDPARAGTAVTESLQNQLNDAQAQFKRGGR